MPGVIRVGCVSFNEAPHSVQGCTLTPVLGGVSVGGSHYGSLEGMGAGPQEPRSYNSSTQARYRLTPHPPPAHFPALCNKALAKSCPYICLRALPSIHSSPHSTKIFSPPLTQPVQGHQPCPIAKSTGQLTPKCVCPAPVLSLSFLLCVSNAHS